MLDLRLTVAQLIDLPDEQWFETLTGIVNARLDRANPAPTRTKEESIRFRKAWDARVQSGKDNNARR